MGKRQRYSFHCRECINVNRAAFTARARCKLGPWHRMKLCSTLIRKPKLGRGRASMPKKPWRAAPEDRDVCVSHSIKELGRLLKKNNNNNTNSHRSQQRHSEVFIPEKENLCSHKNLTQVFITASFVIKPGNSPDTGRRLGQAVRAAYTLWNTTQPLKGVNCGLDTAAGADILHLGHWRRLV